MIYVLILKMWKIRAEKLINLLRWIFIAAIIEENVSFHVSKVKKDSCCLKNLLVITTGQVTNAKTSMVGTQICLPNF